MKPRRVETDNVVPDRSKKSEEVGVMAPSYVNLLIPYSIIVMLVSFHHDFEKFLYDKPDLFYY